MKIKHIELLSESLDRKLELWESGNLPADPVSKRFIVYDGQHNESNYFVSASDIIISDGTADTTSLWTGHYINSQLANISLGLSSIVLPPVPNIAQLFASYSIAPNDGAFILIEDRGLYRFNTGSDEPHVIPGILNDERYNGNWYKISLNTDLYLQKPGTTYTTNNLLMSSGSNEQAGDSGILATDVAIKDLAASSNDIYFANPAGQLNINPGYNKLFLDSLPSYSAGFNGNEDDIAFYDANGNLTNVPGFNAASFVSGTTGIKDDGKIATYNDGVLQQTSLNTNYVLKLGSSDPTNSGYLVQKMSQEDTFVSHSNIALSTLAIKSNTATTSDIYFSDSTGQLKINPGYNKLFLDSLGKPVYTITLAKHGVVSAAGSRTIDMYNGTQIPFPIDNSRMSMVTVEGIVYESSSDNTPGNEEYYVNQVISTVFNLILSSSYTIESDETIMVSYLSYTSSL